MRFRTPFYYLLVLSVLFAASFAAFHSSEHIALEESTAHHHESHSDHNAIHDAHEPKGVQTDSLGGEHHSQELCEACIVLSGSTASVNGIVFFVQCLSKHSFDSRYSFASNAHNFESYLSRAPPNKA